MSVSTSSSTSAAARSKRPRSHPPTAHRSGGPPARLGLPSRALAAWRLCSSGALAMSNTSSLGLRPADAPEDTLSGRSRVGLPRAPASLGQSAAWAALAGSGRPYRTLFSAQVRSQRAAGRAALPPARAAARQGRRAGAARPLLQLLRPRGPELPCATRWEAGPAGPASADQHPAGWPRLAGAWGSLRRGLARWQRPPESQLAEGRAAAFST